MVWGRHSGGQGQVDPEVEVESRENNEPKYELCVVWVESLAHSHERGILRSRLEWRSTAEAVKELRGERVQRKDGASERVCVFVLHRRAGFPSGSASICTLITGSTKNWTTQKVLHYTLWCLRYGNNTTHTNSVMLSWSVPAGSFFRHIHETDTAVTSSWRDWDLVQLRRNDLDNASG